jgi:hypothetical protein
LFGTKTRFAGMSKRLIKQLRLLNCEHAEYRRRPVDEDIEQEKDSFGKLKWFAQQVVRSKQGDRRKKKKACYRWVNGLWSDLGDQTSK